MTYFLNIPFFEEESRPTLERSRFYDSIRLDDFYYRKRDDTKGSVIYRAPCVPSWEVSLAPPVVEWCNENLLSNWDLVLGSRYKDWRDLCELLGIEFESEEDKAMFVLRWI